MIDHYGHDPKQCNSCITLETQLAVRDKQLMNLLPSERETMIAMGLILKERDSAREMAKKLAEALNRSFVSMNFEFDEDRKIVLKEVIKTLALYDQWEGK